jgi:hypothetical protein
MALLTGQNVCDEVAFRISNRLPAGGTGAGSIINCANRVLGLISSAGSYSWEQTTLTGVTATGDSLTLNNCDSGKEMAFFNNPNGTQIVRAKVSDTFTASANFVGLTTTVPIYNTYRLSADTSGLTYVPIAYFFPQTGGNPVNAIYHVLPPTLVYGANPTVQWQQACMDMLLIDWTEAYVKRVLQMAQWDTIWADCIKRVDEYRVTYASQRENTGPEKEQEIMAVDKAGGRD